MRRANSFDRDCQQITHTTNHFIHFTTFKWYTIASVGNVRTTTFTNGVWVYWFAFSHS